MPISPRPARRFVHLALVAATATALVTTGTTAEATSTRSTTDLAAVLIRYPGFAAMPDSLGLNVPVLLHGSLTDTGGAPMSGAEVLLSAWPSRETVDALPMRDDFVTVPIARTIAGPEGRFELRSALTPLLAGLIGPEGLDFELHVFHGGRQYDYLSQVHPVAGLGAWVTSLVDDGHVEPTIGAGTRNLLNIALDPRAGEQLPTGLLGKRAITAPDPRRPGQLTEHDDVFPGHWCSTYKKFDFKNVNQTAAVAVARNGAVAQVTYDEGAYTVTSAGASVNGGVSFEVAGERSTTSTISGTYPKLRSSKGSAVQNRYIVAIKHFVLEQKCMTDLNGGYRLKYKTAPDKTVGTDHENPVRATWRCNPRFEAPASGAISTSTAKAAEFSKGFSFAPLGRAFFGGSTRSGYSKAVAVQFTFGGGSGKGRWCGHSGSPTDEGQVVQGYNR